MLEYEAVRLYHDACKRYNVKPTYDGHKEWRDCLAGIEYDDGLAALNEYENENHKYIPYAQTIWKKATTARKNRITMTKTNPSPYPDKENDNKHFLEWMAEQEGKTPEEMEKHINEYMNEWEKGK